MSRKWKSLHNHKISGNLIKKIKRCKFNNVSHKPNIAQMLFQHATGLKLSRQVAFFGTTKSLRVREAAAPPAAPDARALKPDPARLARGPWGGAAPVSMGTEQVGGHAAPSLRDVRVGEAAPHATAGSMAPAPRPRAAPRGGGERGKPRPGGNMGGDPGDPEKGSRLDGRAHPEARARGVQAPRPGVPLRGHTAVLQARTRGSGAARPVGPRLPVRLHGRVISR